MPARSIPRAPARRAHATVAAYLHHLFKAEEMLGPMLLTWHNVRYYQDLMRGLRAGNPERPARRACRRGCARAGRAGGTDMTDENYGGLTQLGHHVEQPDSRPMQAMLERVASRRRANTMSCVSPVRNSRHCVR